MPTHIHTTLTYMNKNKSQIGSLEKTELKSCSVSTVLLVDKHTEHLLPLTGLTISSELTSDVYQHLSNAGSSSQYRR